MGPGGRPGVAAVTPDPDERNRSLDPLSVSRCTTQVAMRKPMLPAELSGLFPLRASTRYRLQ